MEPHAVAAVVVEVDQAHVGRVEGRQRRVRGGAGGVRVARGGRERRGDRRRARARVARAHVVPGLAEAGHLALAARAVGVDRRLELEVERRQRVDELALAPRAQEAAHEDAARRDDRGLRRRGVA